MHWHDIPAIIDLWVEKSAAPGYDVRQCAANVITASHVGYYYDPISERVGIFSPMATDADAFRVKKAAFQVTGTEPLFLSYQQLSNPDSTWVKVAHSPALRRAGELMNFFPGQYPGGIPNSPSPVAAMLTSGLIGAGLGWGGGKLIGSALPSGYGKKMGRTGAILGGLAGALPGALWAGTNSLSGHEFNDPSLLNHHAGDEPVNYASAIDGTNAGISPAEQPGHAPEMLGRAVNTLTQLKMSNDRRFAGIELGRRYREAVEKTADTFGDRDSDPGHLPTDVNIDHLGRTLWDTGASPHLAASTMAGMYAAQQLPDQRSRPGWVTGNQLGQLAANAAGDYLRGKMVGAAINLAIGTPYSSSVFGTGNMLLGVLGAVVPKLFGG